MNFVMVSKNGQTYVLPAELLEDWSDFEIISHDPEEDALEAAVSDPCNIAICCEGIWLGMEAQI